MEVQELYPIPYTLNAKRYEDTAGKRNKGFLSAGYGRS
jgi:hypothetical protein